MTTPCMLIVLDGWGHAAPGPGNAITTARAPNWAKLMEVGGTTLLDASGHAVGLPACQMGNSEVGHMNIGAGRIIEQESVRITKAIENGFFDSDPTVQRVFQQTREAGKTLHVMGLLSDGGVHSHIDHIVALLKSAEKAGVKTALHAFLDGRDTAPQCAEGYLKTVEALADGSQHVSIRSVSGRYYAMDRDKRWERVQLAFDAVIHGKGPRHDSARAALADAYAKEETDEFVKPRIVGAPTAVEAGDAYVFMNFRADRAKQMTEAIRADSFDEFDRGAYPAPSTFCTLTEYKVGAGEQPLFTKEDITQTLGQVVSDAGIGQFRIAETEKFAHVTYFLNGGRNVSFDGEERLLIESPKVATYDLAPAMRAPDITEALVAKVRAKQHGLYVCNYANADMVGHTGVFGAAVSAVETLDDCLGQLAEAAKASGTHLFITADHGNVEQMRVPGSDDVHTAHTTNPVPLIHLRPDGSKRALDAGGGLANLAPTVLRTMGLPIPEAMKSAALVGAE